MNQPTFALVALLAVTHAIDYTQDDGPHDSSLPIALPWVQSSSPSVSTEPTFVVGDWGKCTAVCGEGIRERTVECKILLQFSRTVAKLPDNECPGQKPPSVGRCYSRPCSSVPTRLKSGPVNDEASSSSNVIRSNKLPKSDDIAYSRSSSSSAGHGKQTAGFAWKSSGFTECSATCLGGTQESVIQCIRLKDQLVVSPYLCSLADKPDVLTRTCADIPCPPRWVVTEYSACSKECGNGVQTRQVQCIHEVALGSENTLTVAHGHCPSPAPRPTQRCNVVECPARWEAGPWSKCSRHCGGGIKTRPAKCVRELSLGQLIEVPAALCPQKPPSPRKVCNKRHCRKDHRAHHSLILPADNGYYVQKEPLRRLSIKVGGRAVVFAGTTLKIRCPRSKSANRTELKVDWYKDNGQITYGKKYQLTARQALRVKRVGTGDGGKYTCSLGTSEASILVSVKPAPPPTPDSPMPPRLDTSGDIVANSVAESETTLSHQVEKPRDIGQTFESSSGSSHTSGHSGGYEQNRVTSHEVPSSGHQRPIFLKGTTGSSSSSSGVGSKDSPTWDTADRVRSSKGIFFADQRTPSDVSQPSSKGEDSEASASVELPSSFHQPMALTSDTDEDNLLVRGTVLGRGNPTNLRFDWITSEWSPCSETCGATGFQVRGIQCVVRFHNVTKPTEQNLCMDAGLTPPPHIRDCETFDCPKWLINPWRACDECVGESTATQRRDIKCILPSGTELEVSSCDNSTRPVDQRDCSNSTCKGTWVAGDWTECRGNCGEVGFQNRILQCVWFGGQTPAGSACQDQPRPVVMRSCQNPCPSAEKCVDRSKHCNLAKALNMCRISHYRRECCASCKDEPFGQTTENPN